MALEKHLSIQTSLPFSTFHGKSAPGLPHHTVKGSTPAATGSSSCWWKLLTHWVAPAEKIFDFLNAPAWRNLDEAVWPLPVTVLRDSPLPGAQLCPVLQNRIRPGAKIPNSGVTGEMGLQDFLFLIFQQFCLL